MNTLFSTAADTFTGDVYDGVMFGDPDCEQGNSGTCSTYRNAACLCYSDQSDQCWDSNYCPGENDPISFGECGSGDYQQGPGVGGCHVYVVEPDGAAYSDCVTAQVAEGTILNDQYTNYASAGAGWVGPETDIDAQRVFTSASFRALSDQAALCKLDSTTQFFYWHRCDQSQIGNTLDALNLAQVPTTFVCVETSTGRYSWEDSTAISPGADSDNDDVPNSFDCVPDDSTIHGGWPNGCVVLGEGETLGPNEVECTIPPANEACGDGIDNDCNPATVDDCTVNADGCRNAGFAWTDTNGANSCCGDSGLNDLGTVVIGSSDAAPRICLNTDNTKVSGDISSLQDGETGTGGWFWSNAQSLDHGFKIITIKKPGQQPYDIVSNTENWIECKGTPGTNGISQGVGDTSATRSANNFYCYQESRRWAWAECLSDPALSRNGIKARGIGDGVFALTVVDPDTPAAVKTIDLNAYDTIYENGPEIDLVGYDFL
ncbi:MAG: hypothetical protein Q8R37_02475, partial [Nanoarchaeota archaeon]|nr:hypothetical protein [Nanoarchaeota archaeon]